VIEHGLKNAEAESERAAKALVVSLNASDNRRANAELTFVHEVALAQVHAAVPKREATNVDTPHFTAGK
jgi:hypothetical protein